MPSTKESGTTFYWRGIRIPRWLFVLLFGEPRLSSDPMARQPQTLEELMRYRDEWERRVFSKDRPE